MSISISLKNQELQVIEAAVRKEKWAQKMIYEEFFGGMMGICLRYARDEQEAMDILHDSFIKIFKNISKYSPNTSLRAWIKRIVINNCIDHYRKMARKRTEDLDTAYAVQTNDPTPIDNLSEQEILACIQELPPSYRTIFNMYVVEGYSHKEIGKTLGITESTSRSNLVKARAKLKEKIRDRD